MGTLWICDHFDTIAFHTEYWKNSIQFWFYIANLLGEELHQWNVSSLIKYIRIFPLTQNKLHSWVCYDTQQTCVFFIPLIFCHRMPIRIDISLSRLRSHPMNIEIAVTLWPCSGRPENLAQNSLFSHFTSIFCPPAKKVVSAICQRDAAKNSKHGWGYRHITR